MSRRATAAILITGWILALLILGIVAALAWATSPFRLAETIGGRRIEAPTWDVSVFLREHVTSEQREAIRLTIEAHERTEKVVYISREQSLKEYIETYPEFSASIDSSGFRASFRIYVQGGEDQFQSLRSALQRHEGVEEVVTPSPEEKSRRRLNNNLRTLRNVWGIGILLILLPITVRWFPRGRTGKPEASARHWDYGSK